MTFKATALMGDRYHVSGTDSLGTAGSTVVDGSQWNQVVGWAKSKQAQLSFDTVVDEFFAPLLTAVKEMEQEHTADSISTMVLEEGTEGSTGVPAKVVTLSKDSIVLRLIEDGETNRLLWINDCLEILERQELPVQADPFSPENTDPFSAEQFSEDEAG